MNHERKTIPYIQDTLQLSAQTHVQDASIHQTLIPNQRSTPQVELKDEHNIIGKGGMGLVRKERQKVPNRLVAVKSLIQDTPQLRSSLIREADLMGRLEHPNIPPVHVVHTDPPQVTMKLIDGVDFSVLLNHTPQRGAALERALDVIIKVSYALEYAHENGIIHRDIKPENIMVGRFDNVYLMDWGISFEQAYPEKALQGLAGTPAYMAPEMLCSDPSIWGTHTDVFLMGALLHEVLTGSPRYNGSSLDEVFTQITECFPHRYSPDIPRDLAVICNRACARAISDRYESVVAFRQAIQEHIQHASALALAKAADKKRQEIMSHVSSVENLLLLDSRYYTLAAQARFGFEQALESWEECAIAEEGLKSIMSFLIRRAILVGDFSRAKQLIEELRDEELQQELASQCAQREEDARQKESKNQRMQSVVDNLDPTKSFGARFLIQASLTLTLIVMFTLLNIVQYDFGAKTQAERKFYAILMMFSPTYLIICLKYKEIMSNAFGRQALRTIGLGSLAYIFVRWVVYLEKIPYEMTDTFEVLVIALALGNSNPAIQHGPKLAIFGLCISLGTILFPPYAHTLMYVMMFTTVFVISWGWHSQDKERKQQKGLFENE